jgi:hypothetical protein
MRKPVISPVSILMTAVVAFGADLPIHEVILYKHGVGFFERAGKLEAGDTARIDFKAEDMNDVLKSLTITDRSGGKISGVRYDASEPLEERLKNFPFAVGADSTLAVFLDQMKGARIELKQYTRPGIAAEAIEGVIVSGRVVKSGEKSADVESITLLTDSGEMRTYDLASASSIKFTDPKLQGLLKDYLSVLNGARSKDRRSVYIDSVGAAARDLVASYMTPSPVWKSSYRLLFSGAGEPTLEGWAIVDNTSGDDWNNVKLSVVSGRPISFITQLYAPKYVNRPFAELADNQAAAPTVFDGPINGRGSAGLQMMAMAKSPPPAPRAVSGFGGGVLGGVPSESEELRTFKSTIASTAEGRDAGDLFEYSFSSPVTVKKGESAMLPFLQQKVGARKLLIYQENFGVNPQNAAEVTNSTGKTLDGGPITVYDAGSYAGEALVETVKASDKRLISYGVDLGTRITTKFDSSRNVVREIHASRGNLTSKYALEEVRTFTIKNVDPKAKTLIIEEPQRQGYKLLEPAKASETTANANRFEVKLSASGTETFVVREERVYDQTTSITSMTPDTISVWLENKVLSANGRRQLEQVAAKKREIANNDAATRQAESGISDLTQDQTRVRANIQSLNSVKNQQDLVQQYASQLAANETKMVALRDSQSDLKRKKTALESELNTLMEKLDF